MKTPTFKDPETTIKPNHKKVLTSEAFEDDEPPITVKDLFKKTPGKKFDQTKTRTDLLCPIALMATADVLTFGAKKYGDRNWEQGIEFSRVYGAALRHLFAFWSGEDYDEESGLPHLDHAAACIHFLQHYTSTGEYSEQDDRPFTV